MESTFGNKIARERGARCWHILDGGAKLCCHCKVDGNGKHNRSAAQETDCGSINLFLAMHSLCVVLVMRFVRVESLVCFIKNIVFCKKLLFVRGLVSDRVSLLARALYLCVYVLVFVIKKIQQESPWCFHGEKVWWLIMNTNSSHDFFFHYLLQMCTVLCLQRQREQM